VDRTTQAIVGPGGIQGPRAGLRLLARQLDLDDQGAQELASAIVDLEEQIIANFDDPAGAGVVWRVFEGRRANGRIGWSARWPPGVNATSDAVAGEVVVTGGSVPSELVVAVTP
jgi:hypothetical protein